MSTTVFGRLGQFLQRLREQGVAAPLRKAFRDHVYQRDDAIALIAPLPLALPPPAPSSTQGYTYRELRLPEDLPRLGRYFAKRRARLLDIEADGASVVASLFEDEIVGLFAGSTRDFYEESANLRVRVPEGHFYMGELHVAAPHRGRGLHLEMMRLALGIAQAAGCHRGYGYISESNPVSLKLHFRMGYREFGTMFVRRQLLGRTWSREGRYEGLRQPGLLEAELQRRSGAPARR